MVFIRHLSAVLITVFALGGCSTFVVSDTYTLVGDKTSSLGYKSNDVELTLMINPDIRFYSAGMFGLPIIPTVIDITDPTELTLAVNLRLYRDYDFNFAVRPCLTDETSQPLCPYRAEVTALAMYQDDGSMHADKSKRWHNVWERDSEHRLLSQLIVPGARNINRERIYQYFNYMPGTSRKWDILLIDFAYKYKCEAVCPDRINVNVADLLTINDLSLPNKNYTYMRKTITDYKFMTDVQ